MGGDAQDVHGPGLNLHEKKTYRRRSSLAVLPLRFDATILCRKRAAAARLEFGA
jgi:hypothetical protein